MFAGSLAAVALASALLLVCAAHPNPIITEDLTSPVTTRIDGQFYTVRPPSAWLLLGCRPCRLHSPAGLCP